MEGFWGPRRLTETRDQAPVATRAARPDLAPNYWVAHAHFASVRIGPAHSSPTGTDRAHKRSLGRRWSAPLWCPRKILSISGRSSRSMKLIILSALHLWPACNNTHLIIQSPRSPWGPAGFRTSDQGARRPENRYDPTSKMTGPRTAPWRRSQLMLWFDPPTRLLNSLIGAKV